MNELLLIGLLYFSSVFVARMLNKIAFKMDNDLPIMWFFWPIPFLNMLMSVIAIAFALVKRIDANCPLFIKRFKGDNW